MDSATQGESMRATRIIQHLIEQEALLADVRRAIEAESANGVFIRYFEELFDTPESAESIQPNGDARDDLSQWTAPTLKQTQQYQTPTEQFLAVSRSSEPMAVYSSLRMAEMKIPEGVQAYAGTRACLLQLVSTQRTACLAARCVSEGRAGATSERSKARTEPTQRRTAQSTLAKNLSCDRAQSV